mmetsp:Transcript_9421/g.26881  ORF Transcript_9421/g.26881 Transcript_9421/m.26881 type:complete len:230 (+) Transcript_9421:355-1044(+)
MVKMRMLRLLCRKFVSVMMQEHGTCKLDELPEEVCTAVRELYTIIRQVSLALHLMMTSNKLKFVQDSRPGSHSEAESGRRMARSDSNNVEELSPPEEQPLGAVGLQRQRRSMFEGKAPVLTPPDGQAVGSDGLGQLLQRRRSTAAGKAREVMPPSGTGRLPQQRKRTVPSRSGEPRQASLATHRDSGMLTMWGRARARIGVKALCTRAILEVYSRPAPVPQPPTEEGDS